MIGMSGVRLSMLSLASQRCWQVVHLSVWADEAGQLFVDVDGPTHNVHLAKTFLSEPTADQVRRSS